MTTGSVERGSLYPNRDTEMIDTCVIEHPLENSTDNIITQLRIILLTSHDLKTLLVEPIAKLLYFKVVRACVSVRVCSSAMTLK